MVRTAVVIRAGPAVGCVRYQRSRPVRGGQDHRRSKPVAARCQDGGKMGRAGPEKGKWLHGDTRRSLFQLRYRHVLTAPQGHGGGAPEAESS
jgi:hypothetical protein